MDGSVAKVDNAKETADLRNAPLIQVPKTTLLIFYNGSRLYLVPTFKTKLI